MKEILLVYQDFHPLFTPEEVIIQFLSAARKTKQNVRSVILLSKEGSVEKDLAFLYKGQYIYMPIPRFNKQPILGFWTWLSLFGVPTAYIHVDNMQLESYQHYPTFSQNQKDHFLVGLAIENAINRGLKLIIIDTQHLSFVRDARTVFYDIIAHVHLYQEKVLPVRVPIYLTFLTCGNKKEVEKWLEGIKKKLFIYKVFYYLVDREEFYERALPQNKLSEIKQVVCITSSHAQKEASDYQYFLNWSQENNIPYTLIENKISSKQDFASNKPVLKQHLESLIKNSYPV